MTNVSTDPDLQAIAARLPAETWAERLATAREEAERLQLALERVHQGVTRRQALAEACPGLPYHSQVKRLRRFEEGGRDALIDRRAPVAYRKKVTPEVRAALRTLRTALPELRPADLAEKVKAALGVDLGESTVREMLRAEGLQHPRGRPGGRRTTDARSEHEAETAKQTRLPLAGAELLTALEGHVGAVRSLTRAIGRHLRDLPDPENEVVEDLAHRDDRGRFQESYNRKDERTDPDLGARFGSVADRRSVKDLPEMQVAQRGAESRYRKDVALTFLPVVVDGPRWCELRHWRGGLLKELVGFDYQPSTLDKYARELKYSGAAEVAREAVAEFWLRLEGVAADASTGLAVLYADGSTKPVWTDQFTRSTKVSKTGRVQPATTTLVLNSGAGTPLIYESYSGGVSLPQHVLGLLARWEKAAGEGTARRLLVVDRECHSTALLKALDQAGVLFIVPVRSTSAGPSSRWEDVGPWTLLDATDPDGRELREATLWLNDSQDPKVPLRLRAVSRRRGPSDGGATWVTNAPLDEFGGHDILRLYGTRWAHQEHVFRDANGAVGLDVHHGYGKKKVTNVAVVDRVERLEAQQRRAETALEAAVLDQTAREREVASQAAANARVEARRTELLTALDVELQRSARVSAESRLRYEILQALDRALPAMNEALQSSREQARRCVDRITTLQAQLDRRDAELAKLKTRTEIYTVDVELDEIMTAYKLTFLNLAHLLMRDYLGVDWQVDTLIRSVLTLPGVRITTDTTETVRITHQPRDPAAMRAVARACERLNALGLHRGSGGERRHLRFELEPQTSERDARGGSG